MTSMRCGLHSGPVTAGVLRGTVSIPALWGHREYHLVSKSTGQQTRFISQRNCRLADRSREVHWVSARQELVQAKGKGDIQTYWLNMKIQSGRFIIWDNGQ
jgi:hypothetical protein